MQTKLIYLQTTSKPDLNVTSFELVRRRLLIWLFPVFTFYFCILPRHMIIKPLVIEICVVHYFLLLNNILKTLFFHVTSINTERGWYNPCCCGWTEQNLNKFIEVVEKNLIFTICVSEPLFNKYIVYYFERWFLNTPLTVYSCLDFYMYVFIKLVYLILLFNNYLVLKNKKSFSQKGSFSKIYYSLGYFQILRLSFLK